jgi:hypothetical protein
VRAARQSTKEEAGSLHSVIEEVCWAFSYASISSLLGLEHIASRSRLTKLNVLGLLNGLLPFRCGQQNALTVGPEPYSLAKPTLLWFCRLLLCFLLLLG